MSEPALVLRLVELGEATFDLYRSRRRAYERRAAEARAREGGHVPPHTMAIARNGHEFTRLVLDAYQRDAITERRAAAYRRVSYEHVPKIEDAIVRLAWKAAS